MLTLVYFFIAGLLTALTIGQTVYALRYGRILLGSLNSVSNQNEARPDEVLPTSKESVAVVLCLRGVDPTLDDCLAGLERQKVDFQLHLVFDNLDDPAAEYVQAYFSQKPIQPVMHFNIDRPSSCSLKCSGLTTAIGSLPDAVEFVALIDADAVADENWLRDLLAPFVDPQVGATTGNRWFSPESRNSGSVVRQVWNAAAIVQVVIYNIGWGGALAFRKSAIEQCNLLQLWQHTFCEDTMVASSLKQQQFKLQRIPNLIMENTETTTLRDAFNWITRQMLTVRLHHRMWPAVLSHGLLTGVVFYLTPILLIGGMIFETPGQMALLIVFLLYQGFNLGLLMLVQSCNEQVLESRTSPGARRRSGFNNVPHLMLGAVLNQLLYPLAIIKTWRMRSTFWRGIEYEILPGNVLHMKKYLPYREVIAARENESAEGSIQ